jgi:hypothetical protein
VRGFVEYSGVTVINETSMVGVQKSKTTLSQITSDKLNTNIKVRRHPGLRKLAIKLLLGLLNTNKQQWQQ